MYPDGWERTHLATIVQRLESGVSVNGEDRPAADGEAGVLKVSAVSSGEFNARENKAVIDAEQTRLRLSPRCGDVLVSRANTPELIGASGYVDADFPRLFLPDKLWRVVLRNPQRDSAKWLTHVLNSPAMRASLRRRASGSSRSMKNISKDTFLAIDVNRPPRVEQDRITRVLDHWVQATRLAGSLLKLKRRLKYGLAQQLLNGRCRFPEFAGQPWPEVRLREVAQAVVVRNDGALDRSRVMAVTKVSGMIPMKPELIADSINRYQVVESQEFAYNPMRLNIGSIARWRGAHQVLVSPDYVVFRCRPIKLDPDFLDQFRRTQMWMSFVSACGNGSVRVRIWFDDLGQMRLKLPPLAEQKRIAAVLNTADREIDLLEEQLAALRLQKMGLMEQLLTGKVRVKALSGAVAKQGTSS